MKAALLISSFLSVLVAGPVPYYFSTKLDHYSAGGAETPMFNMKYLVDTQYFSNASSGLPRPIFFYAGNEGAIETGYRRITVVSEERLVGTSSTRRRDDQSDHTTDRQEGDALRESVREDSE